MMLQNSLLQDLKTVSFGAFFTDTRDACLSCIHDDEGLAFFDLLASQVTQRLLKSAGGNGGKDQKGGKLNTQYIKMFIDEMIAFGTRAGMEDGEQHMVAGSIKVLLEEGSVPEAIVEANQKVSTSDHWLAKAFALDNGKRMLKTATENANKRSTVNTILVSVAESFRAVTASNEELVMGKKCDVQHGEKSLVIYKYANFGG